MSSHDEPRQGSNILAPRQTGMMPLNYQGSGGQAQLVLIRNMTVYDREVGRGHPE